MDPDAAEDRRFMAAALALGRRGLGRTAPNPSVGALVVKDGIVFGRGWTGDGGRPHGETLALAQAGAAARDATIYVSLEPCSHHGRTGPCCEAIVAAGIRRLVYALDDPNADAGGGAAFCRSRGLEVTAGVCGDCARADHLGHIRRVTRSRPAVTVKLAETADGYVAGGPHDPRLSITGAAAHGAVHVMRAMHDALMVGIGTVVADDPLLTVRLPGATAKPLRIVLDSAMRIAATSRLLQTAGDYPVLVFAGRSHLERRGASPAIAGLETVAVDLRPDGHLDMDAVLAVLADRGLTRLFSEGGPTVAASLIDEGFADDIIIVTAPRPLGRRGIPTLDRASRAALNDGSRYHLVDDREIGIDRLRHYRRVD